MAHGLSYSKACGVIEPGLKPVSPILAGGCFPTEPAQKSQSLELRKVITVAGPGEWAIQAQKTPTPREFSGVEFERLNLG